ncbi:MAG: NAD(P)/FAD-dependent oxidoreductase [Myxococcales bacterium]|nr:NAD(P)/FAD-dependent oxidoreductase [Myxococcales bacterium]
MRDLSVDVAIIGGGLAGSLLARQLRQTLPALSVAVFERSTESSFKVGESTVEIASHYLSRRLGLSSYLYDRHLPKNGLRFFFDTPERDAELTKMSELGSNGFPPLPAFQVDRARLEADLWAMNREDGVDLRLGARVMEVNLDESGARPRSHRLTVLSAEGETLDVRCRWVVDASGRASVLARQQRLRVPIDDHGIASVWGRYRGVADMDQIHDPAWNKRVRFTHRTLSTNHFCYPGYWIWFIPIGRGLTSVGVVCEHGVFSDAMRKPEGFAAFLDRHRAVRDLLAGAEQIDVMGYKQLAYATTRYFSPDGWYLTGESAAFSDPFYSPGSDFIALENDYITDLIRREVAGESADEVRALATTYDQYMRYRFKSTMLIYKHLYPVLGSYELLCLKWSFDIASYYNIWGHLYINDLHLDARQLRAELRRQVPILDGQERFAALFHKLGVELKRQGNYYRSNLGQFTYGIEHIDFLDEIFAPRSRRRVMEVNVALFNLIRDRAHRILHGPDAEVPPLDLAAFSDQTLI